MRVRLTESTCIVEREGTDPKFYGVRNAAGESCLLHTLKETLKKKGHDIIKKRMWKDGHMVDELQQYIRTRSPKSPKPHIAIYNTQWAIRGAEVPWNEDGVVVLGLIRDIFKLEETTDDSRSLEGNEGERTPSG